jgi:carbamoyl-phosphate synthase large subunit
VPRRDDIRTILLLGSGPIVIGQGCEFDYSGTQAVRALREEGYRVVLVNSNPATIMTDPDLADRTYIEPITPEWVERIIERERPEALLPTMGGQTALNVALELHDRGVLERWNVELIGADARAIRMAEDREEFAEAMARIGLGSPRAASPGAWRRPWPSWRRRATRPSSARRSRWAGPGAGSRTTWRSSGSAVQRGLDLSPVHEVLIDRSVIGWKEYELEMMRDGADNVVVVCSIENIDPMGVHTGDSITVAPAQTLSDVRVPGHAGRGHRHHPGDRGGGGRLQHPVRGEPGGRRAAGHRDEPARVPVLGAGVEGHGFPIARIGAKLAVGYRSGRAAQRHHGRRRRPSSRCWTTWW